MTDLRIGNGFDVHAFEQGRDLIIGGVKIPHPEGLAGHSDADVLTHAIIDSLLSPSNLGDIGKLFPDTDPAYKNISSIILLEKVYEKFTDAGYRIINIDSVIICDTPKIAPYTQLMKQALSKAMKNEVQPEAIGIKGKTTEKLGFTGRGEGIAVYTVSLISRK
ncbi:MAG TPA: 2-C-methyl-D-erythritol 2,4-cyclodiphosphate synthase [Spirochaetota bacterium]|nr:2-C-methyl-D-erythritol 2,4-cyclodiphosphate synthase [Spirochaetota bacterium]HPF04444.1 2-C-methyl-D-erythritol 2,4-cyclodiphosphate synthase [Spirochaetota bacterium]HPJ40784.1 2-C-methyl-D-erythritol 2,4-cyclodiphosphate synthase [Spirochaetota bacterium]HPR36053.1 2-C-methyl-D-erythritol 2,4-cyclodiphosphate synthase [Spirochaetota bacterium]